MTVRELIERLDTFPQDFPVRLEVDDDAAPVRRGYYQLGVERLDTSVAEDTCIVVTVGEKIRR